MLKREKAIHIDISVKLAEVKIIFSIASLSFEGDLPASLFHRGFLLIRCRLEGQVPNRRVFHTNAGCVTLQDSAYNADRV